MITPSAEPVPSSGDRAPLAGQDRPRALAVAFLERAEREASTVALRYKMLGLWREVTWGGYRSNVERFALGLVDLGVRSGDCVAVMGRPTPEWLYADVAIQSIGGATLGLYLTTPVEELRHQVEASGARIFVAEGQEYVDKLFEAEAAAGEHLVDHIVVVDTQGMLGQTSPRLHSFSDVQDRGEAPLSADADAWRRLVAERTDTDPVRLFFTAGTTDQPKGLLLSSRNLIESWGRMFASIDRPPGPKDRSVSSMPMAHVGEMVFSVVVPILFGSIPHFPEDEDAVNEAMVEVSPTLLLAFPRVLELHASKALIDLETGSGLKRRAYEVAVRLRRGGGRGVGHWLAYQLLFRHLLNSFGFRSVRLAMTGGAPVSPDLVRLWDEWGVPLREFYGLVECGGIASFQSGARPRPGSAGTATPGVELRLAADGEVLVRGPGVFDGYLTPAGQQSGIDAEGWLHTGDLAEELDDGSIRILDRKQDLLTLAAGDAVVPSELEHALKYGPYVRDALVVAEGRRAVGALIAIDVENVSQWARKEKIVYTSASNLIANGKVRELIQRSVDNANDRLAEAGSARRIETFRLLPKELDSGDEITPTRTMKRRQLELKFGDLVDEMFAANEAPSEGARPSRGDGSA